MEPETKKSDKPPNFDNRESAKSGRVAGEVATRKARGNRELPHADPLHNLLLHRPINGVDHQSQIQATGERLHPPAAHLRTPLEGTRF